MGCCSSRPSTGPSTPYPSGGTDPSASTRPINDTVAVAAAATTTTSTANNSTAAQHQQTSREATSPSSSPSSPASPSRHHRRRSHQAAAAAPLSQHINKPLRPHRWTAPCAAVPSSRRQGSSHLQTRRRWTRAALDRERRDFFDTRVAGRPEVWQVVRAALEVLWEEEQVEAGRGRGRGRGDDDDDGGDEEADEDKSSGFAKRGARDGERGKGGVAVATAQSILDAADVTLPTGDLAQGAYDALGNYYALPEWVVSDPDNVVADGEGDDDLEKGSAGSGDESESEEGEGGGGGFAAAAGGCRSLRREEKGKAIAHDDDGDDDDVLVVGGDDKAADLVVVRARLSETARDVVVRVGRGENVKVLARKVTEKAKLPPTARIRIAYLGKILREHSSLAAQGWQEGHVVNALVFHGK